MLMPMMHGRYEQPDAEEHESVPEDLEPAADQVEEAFATWQESRPSHERDGKSARGSTL